MPFDLSRRALVAALVLAASAAVPAAAQSAPAPGELPWNARPATVRAMVARLGWQPRAGSATVVQGDSAFTFSGPAGGGATAELTARFRGGKLWHAFYVVRGDSTTLQRLLDRSAAHTSARHGQARADGASRVWTLPNGNRFTLPGAPTRVEGGAFTFAVVYHRV